MNLTRAARLLEDLSVKDVNVPILFVGPTSSAKSAMVLQTAEKLNLPCVELRTALMDPSELGGIPRPQGDITVWLKPSWFPLSDEEWKAIPDNAKKGLIAVVNNIRRYGPKGFLFLDEVNRGNLETVQAIFQLLTEHRIHEHILPNYLIVGAINPEENYTTTYGLDHAFWSRWIQIVITPKLEEDLRYAAAKGYPEDILGLWSLMPKIVNIQEKCELKVIPTRRGWEFVKKLETAEIINPANPEDVEIVAGCVGDEAAQLYFKYKTTKMEKVISGKDILEKYSEEHKATISRYIKENKSDYLTATAMQVAAHTHNIAARERIVDNFVKFLQDLPNEYRVAVLSRAKTKFLDVIIQKYPNLAEDINKAISQIL